MKVIEAKEFTYAFSCGDCKSRLEVQAEDVRVAEFGSCLSGYSRHPYVTCPVCDEDTKITWNKLPAKVEAMAERASNS